MILEFFTRRKRIKMYEQIILRLQEEIDNLRDGKTTLRLQRCELREEVAELKKTLLELKGKNK